VPSTPDSRPSAGEQRPRPVLAGESELERLLARRGGRTVALGLALLLAEPAYALLDLGQRLGGAVVLGVEVDLAAVEPGDLGLERGELALGAGRAGPGVGECRRQPVALSLAGLDPAAARGDLAGQASETLAPVGRGAGRRREPALLAPSAASTACRAATASASRARSRSTPAAMSASSARTPAASRSSSSGSRRSADARPRPRRR
jgi:hypothetical protein